MGDYDSPEIHSELTKGKEMISLMEESKENIYRVVHLITGRKGECVFINMALIYLGMIANKWGMLSEAKRRIFFFFFSR